MKIKLMNVDVWLNDGENCFTVENYRITPTKQYVTNTQHRKHKQNAVIEFEGKQDESIIFSCGLEGNVDNPKRRKLKDDILTIGSLLTGTNWMQYSRRKHRSSPLVAHPYLDNILRDGKDEIESYFNAAFSCIQDTNWQLQYENGFHLRMILNHSNITNEESRFLSSIVIWEWLYIHLKYPNRLDKMYSLNDIINQITKHFWPSMVFNGKNIFQVLRNQLAHSGKLPIDRSYSDAWMCALDNDSPYPKPGIKQYIQFFDRLTQVIVLRTLNINAEHIISSELKNFLKEGNL